MSIQVKIIKNFMGDNVRLQNKEGGKPVIIGLTELRFLIGVHEGSGELTHIAWSVTASGEVQVKNSKSPIYCVTFQKEEVIPLLPDEKRVG